jgi:hypothetical protein
MSLSWSRTLFVLAGDRSDVRQEETTVSFPELCMVSGFIPETGSKMAGRVDYTINLNSF